MTGLQQVRLAIDWILQADLDESTEMPGWHVQAPLFTIKSKLFAKSTFVIGYDTAIRLIMPKYYGSEAKMLLELAAMRYRGCNLIVAGRIDEDRTFRTMSDVTLPDGLDTLVRFLNSRPFPRAALAAKLLTKDTEPHELMSVII